jgi:hypothetical protein
MAFDMNKPVWIRTCYAPDLQGAWEETLEAAAYLDEVDSILLLDNEDLYGDYGVGWAKILLRLPLLPDAVPYARSDPGLDEGEFHLNPPDDERFLPIQNASLREKQAVYLIDEEALRNKMVKILFLDIHGHAVWHNTIAPESIWEYEANYFKGGGMTRVMERYHELGPHPGAQLTY